VKPWKYNELTAGTKADILLPLIPQNIRKVKKERKREKKIESILFKMPSGHYGNSITKR
jgi:hypothetical protein